MSTSTHATSCQAAPPPAGPSVAGAVTEKSTYSPCTRSEVGSKSGAMEGPAGGWRSATMADTAAALALPARSTARA